MAVAVNDVFNFSLEHRLFGQILYNTFACKVTAVPAATAEETWVDNWFADATGYFNLGANLRSTIIAAQVPEVTHLRWHVSRVTPNPTQVFLRDCVTDTVGDLIGTCETANLALSISRKGLTAGRRFKGRIAVAGSPNEEMGSGVFSANQIARGANIAVNLRGSKVRVAGDSVDVGFWNPGGTRLVNGSPVIYLPQFVGAVTTNVQSTIRVQRSRTVGVGR